jgi:two-component sensor histidine kinase
MDQPVHLSLEVPNDQHSIGVVRHTVGAALERCGPVTVAVVSLVVTELVTNAVLHARLDPRAMIEVDLKIDGGGIRGSVADPGDGFELPDDPQPRADGGFGLLIVKRLVRRWGSHRSNGRHVVWFEL